MTGCMRNTAAPPENKPPAVTPFPWNWLLDVLVTSRWAYLSMNPLPPECGHRSWQAGCLYWRHLEPGEGKHDNVLDWYLLRLLLTMTVCVRTVDALIKSHHGRSGYHCLRVSFGDHFRVAAVQRCGADLLFVQSGDPQTGARSFHPQLDVLQPVAKRVQHATNSCRDRDHGPPRR